MKYIELSVPCTDETRREILMAELSDFPFESFCEEEDRLKAYMPEPEYARCEPEIAQWLRDKGLPCTAEALPDRNWNEVWESNFEPIEVEGRCRIRAPFHPRNPACEYDIEIMPKMSFGTGHHATTYLMAAELLDSDPSGLRGLDMGSGTGVLAILAVLRGAVHMDAVDIDEWAYENGTENIEANGMTGRVQPLLGDAGLLTGRHYDFILANINRNILLRDMEAYRDALAPGGTLTVSGILEADIEAIERTGLSLGLHPVRRRTRSGWAAVRFERR